jgi:hypothetical protein
MLRKTIEVIELITRRIKNSIFAGSVWFTYIGKIDENI